MEINGFIGTLKQNQKNGIFNDKNMKSLQNLFYLSHILSLMIDVNMEHRT